MYRAGAAPGREQGRKPGSRHCSGEMGPCRKFARWLGQEGIKVLDRDIERCGNTGDLRSVPGRVDWPLERLQVPLALECYITEIPT